VLKRGVWSSKSLVSQKIRRDISYDACANVNWVYGANLVSSWLNLVNTVPYSRAGLADLVSLVKANYYLTKKVVKCEILLLSKNALYLIFRNIFSPCVQNTVDRYNNIKKCTKKYIDIGFLYSTFLTAFWFDKAPNFQWIFV